MRAALGQRRVAIHTYSSKGIDIVNGSIQPFKLVAHVPENRGSQHFDRL